MLIGISGKLGSGKDEIAKSAIKDGFGYRIAFADQVKDLVINCFNLNKDLVYGSQKDKETLTHVRWDTINIPMSLLIKYRNVAIDPKQVYLSIREILQIVGTDMMRSFDPNVWINLAFNNMEKTDKHVIITDVRFKNEAKAIEDAGGIIVRLTRNIDAPSTHPSEVEMDYYDFSYILDNKNMTIDEQYTAFKAIIMAV